MAFSAFAENNYNSENHFEAFKTKRHVEKNQVKLR